MRTEIARMQRALATTTVYVTHDQTEALTLGDRVAVLRKGSLQQVASPRELYEQPVNLFVAGFIGSPPMNFLPARVRGDVLELPFGEVPKPASIGGGHDGKLLIVGVRPEHFDDVEVTDAPAGAVTFDVQVDVTEWLGNELYAYIPFEAEAETKKQLEELDRELDGESLRNQLVVTLDAMSAVRDGDSARLWFDPQRMHVFDPSTGANLTRDEERAKKISEQSELLRKRSLERAQAQAANAPANA
jgi:multiple sugar transport system ATP-binding protein